MRNNIYKEEEKKMTQETEQTVTLQDIGSMIDKKAIAAQVAKKIQQEIRRRCAEKL